jgi:tripartite-type tricarboxylate transporter receptor subunit TctC
MTRKSCWITLSAASLVLAVAQPVNAQGYPSKPIRVIVPYATGGATDLIARLVGQKLTERLGQPVIVENRPGAGGVIGAEAGARAPADGHTVLLAVPAEMVILPHLQKMPYRVERDFAPVSLAAVTPLILVVHPALPVKTVQNLIALARSRPGQLTYASAGTGGVQHLAGELLKINAKIDLLHVPYKGAGPVMPDLLGGHVPMFFSGMPPAMPHVRAGKLRALAVTTAKRSPTVPEVPTMQESGMPGFDISNWFAYFVPAGTPAEAITKLNAEMNRALKLQDVREKLASVGAEVVGTSPQELEKFVQVESDKFAQLIKASGAKATD